jgi:hypothetical protein
MASITAFTLQELATAFRDAALCALPPQGGHGRPRVLVAERICISAALIPNSKVSKTAMRFRFAGTAGRSAGGPERVDMVWCLAAPFEVTITRETETAGA